MRSPASPSTPDDYGPTPQDEEQAAQAAEDAYIRYLEGPNR